MATDRERLAEMMQQRTALEQQQKETQHQATARKEETATASLADMRGWAADNIKGESLRTGHTLDVSGGEASVEITTQRMEDTPKQHPVVIVTLEDEATFTVNDRAKRTTDNGLSLEEAKNVVLTALADVNEQTLKKVFPPIR